MVEEQQIACCQVEHLTIAGASTYDGRRFWEQPRNSQIRVHAPGTNVVVAVPPRTDRPAYLIDSGASFATAYVSGLVAYFRSLPAAWTAGTEGDALSDPADVKKLIRRLSRALNPKVEDENVVRIVWKGQDLGTNCMLNPGRVNPPQPGPPPVKGLPPLPPLPPGATRRRARGLRYRHIEMDDNLASPLLPPSPKDLPTTPAFEALPEDAPNPTWLKTPTPNPGPSLASTLPSSASATPTSAAPTTTFVTTITPTAWSPPQPTKGFWLAESHYGAGTT
ncbi:hypothetical protein MFIFM68171_03521 [Madurella fahalii]|uniref:Uncharacterized protein n=1 Tax=Madurella fahalii TaxID=1157608 RepID=A0ABQ0G6A7_9PEZI